MPFSDHVPPTARSFDEYVRMFGLVDDDANRRILAVGEGLSNFNAEATRRGWQVVSIDPLYSHDAVELRAQFVTTLDAIVPGVSRAAQHWIWSVHESPEALKTYRNRIADDFLADFPAGLDAGRYRALSLPALPFRDDEFDLVLCSHLLFTWSRRLDLTFHVQSVREMMRVGREARVFPTNQSLRAEHSQHFDDVCEAITGEGLSLDLVWSGLGNRDPTTERRVIRRGATAAADLLSARELDRRRS